MVHRQTLVRTLVVASVLLVHSVSSYTFQSESDLGDSIGQVKAEGSDDSGSLDCSTSGSTSTSGSGLWTETETDGEADSASSSAVQSTTSGSNHVQHKIRSGSTPVRGTNLGGWLIPEHWMTSSSKLWTGASESQKSGGLYQTLAKVNARSLAETSQNTNNNNNSTQDVSTTSANFEQHMQTFITEEHIKAIAQSGLNTVRVPIGYWIVGNDTEDPSGRAEWRVYPTNTVQYVDQLIKNWALKHNVAVLLSIHAAKGSQNGNDHSSPTQPGKTYWSEYPENVQNTIQVAKFLASRYKNDAAFLGIGLLNEPNGATDEKVLYQYYQDAYAAVRAISSDCVLTVMPLLYKQNCDSMAGFMEAPKFTNVWVEWHPYFIWGQEQTSASDLVDQVISTEYAAKLNEWNARANANKLFFGEWSLANTGQFPNVDTPAFENWARAQIKVMSMAKGGWTYWSWRISGDENAGAFNAWSLRNVLSKSSLKSIVLP